MSRHKVTSDLWWKNGLIYCLDVQTFHDSDGDGHGDIGGVIERIDYLAGMGVTCLWLMPFYATAGRDDGYDVTDYYAVDDRLGTLGDFTEMVRTARDRGMRVIADLVVNHTSIHHPWFQSARSSRDSPYRDFYVWSDEKPPDDGEVVFPDQEDSNWDWDEQAGQWYLHRFYAEQPDLNVANPQVRDEISQIAGFWLQQGLSGFRVDAVPFLIEPAGLPEGAIEDPHELLRDLRAYLGRRAGEAILLGEVNLPPADQAPFFGSDGRRELDLVFDFHAMQYMYLALARGRAAPLEDALRRLPEIPPECGWASFVRNHDELTLDQLADGERDEVFAAFGPDEDMQLYGRGLRRRLPPMLGGDERRIRLVYALAFALPGIPTLFYGEEIGMGEHLAIPGRLAVRSPMQWSAEPHAGFAPPGAGELVRPVTEGRFGPEAVNAVDQRRDPGSLLNWFERLIRRRRECPEIGHGAFTILDHDAPSVLAHRCDWGERGLVALHNLAGRACTVEVTLEDADRVDALIDLFGHEEHGLGDGGRLRVELEPHGWRWLGLLRPGARRRV
ncbi:alpha-amylase family protein [Miltoncostaea marina]|uniref:alpha-amylase family protein n=1 Tax=Miltoncostaea marina TaxID=2843215 RepID=UPI001C3CC2A7|nr:alpha-amylase family protein [Miltoncostaea marina]